MIISSPVPIPLFAPQGKGANVIVANGGANPLNLAYDYGLCANGGGIQLAAGAATTQFFVAGGQTLYASAPAGATQANVMVS